MPLFKKSTFQPVLKSEQAELTLWYIKELMEKGAKGYVEEARAGYLISLEKETKRRKINLATMYGTLVQELDFDNLVDQLGELRQIVCNAAHLNGQIEQKARFNGFQQKLNFTNRASFEEDLTGSSAKAALAPTKVTPICSLKQLLALLDQEKWSEADQKNLYGFLLTSEMQIYPALDFAGELGDLFKQTLETIDACAKNMNDTAQIAQLKY